MPDDSLFFKITSPIPIIGDIIHVWKTHLLYNEAVVADRVSFSPILMPEQMDLVEQSVTKHWHCCKFAANTPPVWVQVAMVVATFVLSFTFAPLSVANAIIAAAVVTKIGRKLYWLHIPGCLGDFTERPGKQGHAAAVRYALISLRNSSA